MSLPATAPHAQPRSIHPWAWWCWSIFLALAISATTNPLFLALFALAITAVVLLRRSDAPWARSVGAYFALAAMIIAIRVAFQILMGSSTGETVLFFLPEIPLPEWAAGIRLGGPVTAEDLVYTVYDGLRLGVMLMCLGAANSLANPRQALRSVPAALYEASVAVVIALSVAPQLIESAGRVRRARRLRGGSGGGWRGAAAIVIPVLEDAVERSMALAAGMEARGFARTRGAEGRGTLLLMLGSMLIASLGTFLLLGSSDALPVALTCLGVGVAGTAWGLRLAGRRLQVTHYRPHPWGLRETCVAGCGVMAAGVTFFLVEPAALNPSTDPLVWPPLQPEMLAVAALAALPLVFTGPPRPGREVEPAAAATRAQSPRPRQLQAVGR